MIPAPIPPNEMQRLNALRSLLILDTPPEERFDRITRFAASEFDTPVALVSLIDERRQWFKARVGLDACETSRDISFCGHAIEGSNVLVIGDARDDPRFADNPLVTGDPFIRFYAGAPLILPGGLSVGTLCLIDTEPRTFSRIDQSILCALRDVVVEELMREAATP
ncbi:MAG: GAF domain-containing protein [Burkholderiales bacterium]|nr:GAF domain-containing protein [Burkholderiales bacterium]